MRKLIGRRRRLVAANDNDDDSDNVDVENESDGQPRRMKKQKNRSKDGKVSLSLALRYTLHNLFLVHDTYESDSQSSFALFATFLVMYFTTLQYIYTALSCAGPD